MLKDHPTQGMLPVQDMKRARTFYEQILGLVPVDTLLDGGVIYEPGGTRIRLFLSRGIPSGDQTQLGFEVEGIRALVRDLEDKGVKFEDSDYMPEATREGHLIDIVPYNCAFFRDSEGNSLGIWELDSAPATQAAASLNNCPSQSNLSAQDIKRARGFYERQLGFSPVEQFADGGVAYEAGGTQFLVSPTSGKPSGRHPQIAFIVREVEAEIAELEHLRIGVERSETGNVLFKDSEGNLLSLESP